MSQIIQGIIHGKTIELRDNPGLGEGQEVEVVIRTLPGNKKWGEGIKRSAGGWSDYPEMDAVMEKIHQERKRERRPTVEE